MKFFLAQCVSFILGAVVAVVIMPQLNPQVALDQMVLITGHTKQPLSESVHLQSTMLINVPIVLLSKYVSSRP